MTRMEITHGCLLQRWAVANRESLSSGLWLLPAQLGGGAHVSVQGAPCVRASYCQVSPAHPNDSGTSTAAEEAENDRGCCIVGANALMHPTAGSSPGMALQITLCYWDGQRSLSIGEHVSPRPSHVCTRVY